jgi:hypothetical protein
VPSTVAPAAANIKQQARPPSRLRREAQMISNSSALADCPGAIEISHFAYDRLPSSAFFGGRVQPTTRMA